MEQSQYVLSQAKKVVNFDLYVAKVSIVQIGSASIYYSRYGHDYSLGDLNEEFATAENIKSLEGHCISDIDLEKEQMISLRILILKRKILKTTGMQVPLLISSVTGLLC